MSSYFRQPVLMRESPLRHCMASQLGTHSSALLLLLLVLQQALGSRGGSSRGVQQGGAALGDGTGGGALSGNNSGCSKPRRLKGATMPRLTEPGRTVVLYTQFGDIRIRLLEILAPRITALVWDLAARRGCQSTHTCAFYRIEARPQTGLGPPYALLQGRMHDLKQDPPFEGNIEVKRGHVCFIPGGKDWFISLGDHPEWGTSHPVWGLVEDWATVDAIVSQQYSNWTHPEHGTVLRLLRIEVPWKVAVESDRTYAGPVP